MSAVLVPLQHEDDHDAPLIRRVSAHGPSAHGARCSTCEPESAATRPDAPTSRSAPRGVRHATPRGTSARKRNLFGISSELAPTQMISLASFSTAFIAGVNAGSASPFSSAVRELRRHRNSSVRRRIRNDACRPAVSVTSLITTSCATSGGLGGSTRVTRRISFTLAYTRQPPAKRNAAVDNHQASADARDRHRRAGSPDVVLMATGSCAPRWCRIGATSVLAPNCIPSRWLERAKTAKSHQ